MRVVKIPKRNGKFRTIYVPDAKEKAVYHKSLESISDRAEALCHGGVVHGFMFGKSPVTNAMRHVGKIYTTCFDLKDFFDTVGMRQLRGILPKETLDLVLVDGAARQGLPTSPAVANIAANFMDRRILRWIKRKKLDVVYTRYADDLSFSYDDSSVTEMLKREIPDIVERFGFKANCSKTHTMCALGGRRIICGVAVDNEIHPTRKTKRRLRAAQHHNKFPQAAGLTEWCKLKIPASYRLRQMKG